MKRVFLSIFFLPTILYAQKIFSLEIKFSPVAVLTAKNPYKRSFTSILERDKEIQRVLLTLYDNAYLTAAIDSIVSPSSKEEALVYIQTGVQYKWAKLKKGNIDEGILSETGYREKFFTETPFSYKEVRRVQEEILIHCENNGFPFASLKLDSILISGETISASLNLQKNLLVKIDSVVNRGTAKISSIYLQSYLGIKDGNLYNEALVKKIGMRINELPFIKERIPFRVLFPGEKAKVELFLEKKRASQFDGIIGLLPDNKTGKILLTGDVQLRLNNSFSQGELFELNWKRLQVGTQDLKTRLIFPFLLKTPFGIDANFKLYKRDSTYLEVNPNVGIQYQHTGGNYFKAFVSQKKMVLLYTKGMENITVLPLYADITSSIYGISVKSEKLDYRLNPRKGYSVIGTLGVGNKTIKKNEQLNENIYSGLKLNTVQYSAELEADIFIPIKRRSAVKFGTRSAYLQNSTLFLNELFRIGGLKSLRGFDEESIFASSYYIFTMEYRYLLEENSYLYFFTDGAYYENQSISFTGDRYDTPIGFGAGISFETKAGIFSINYALGKQFNNPIDLRSGKVHFGIVNYF